ncbi:MAG: hypothetical protein OFPI_09600 [Osedax symbiont Rs2]|nr:MAG: hypothetical protein OFPI_09600 [Osedax symbiont Rs2]
MDLAIFQHFLLTERLGLKDQDIVFNLIYSLGPFKSIVS